MIQSFFKSKKTAFTGLVMALVAVAHHLSYLDSEQMASLMAVAGSFGFIVSKDADKTGL